MFETMRRCARAAGALLALGLTACGAARTVITPDPPRSVAPSFLIADADLNRDPRAVDAAGALADLDAALRVFDEAYAGLDGAPRLPDAAAIAAARRRLAEKGAFTPAELTAELRALLGRPDGHLAFSPAGRGASKGGFAPLRSRWSLPQAGPEPVSPETSSFSSAITEGPRTADPVSVTSGEVPVLAIRTFDPAARRMLSLLPAIARELRRERAFVVDLRGNGGGDYAFAEAFVLALTDRTLRRLDEREVRSVAASEGRANSARRRLLAGVPIEARPVFDAHIAAREAEARALREASAPRTEIITRGAVVKGTADGPLRARAVLLVDHGCASACEMMIALARQIPGVIIAGEPTRGGMAVGELALFRLPASGVTISLGTRAFHDSSGAFAETRGFLPDVPLDEDHALPEARLLALGLAPRPTP